MDSACGEHPSRVESCVSPLRGRMPERVARKEEKLHYGGKKFPHHLL
jgi:hypothetical protein